MQEPHGDFDRPARPVVLTFAVGNCCASARRRQVRSPTARRRRPETRDGWGSKDWEFFVMTDASIQLGWASRARRGWKTALLCCAAASSIDVYAYVGCRFKPRKAGDVGKCGESLNRAFRALFAAHIVVFRHTPTRSSTLESADGLTRSNGSRGGDRKHEATTGKDEIETVHDSATTHRSRPAQLQSMVANQTLEDYALATPERAQMVELLGGQYRDRRGLIPGARGHRRSITVNWLRQCDQRHPRRRRFDLSHLHTDRVLRRDL